jgi:hypothetical protein
LSEKPQSLSQLNPLNGQADSNVATVSLTNSINDAPVAVDDSYTTSENAALSITVPPTLLARADEVIE